tara:strand:+ start:3753 stop:5408 length:1656 start_codon:yes stop_codon:yes gene_type:complete
MSVIGIDYGNSTTKICSFYNGVFKNIDSETNKRVLPSLVVFDNDIRYFSDFAKSKKNKCIKQIVYNIKSKIHDEEYKSYLYLNKEDSKKYIINGFKLCYMYLTYIHKYVRTKIQPDIYIHTFPDYYTYNQLLNYNNLLKTNKKMVSSMNYLLIPESIAISLDYGLYRIANNEFNKKKIILFIDIGCSNISFYVVEYIDKSIMVTFHWTLKDCGSIQMDKLLLQYLIKEFKNNLKNVNVEIMDDNIEKKIIKILYIECENIRKKLNISNEINIFMESLYKDYNLDLKLNRDKYINILNDIICKIKNTIEIINRNFTFNSIELVGGFSRFFIFRDTLNLYLKKINTTLNLEESISKGACIYGANFLPMYKNIDIDIYYKYGSSITLEINGLKKKIIDENNYLPFTKRLPLPKNKCNLKIYYEEDLVYDEFINIKQVNLSLKIGLDRLHHFIIEYVNSNNKMAIKPIEINNNVVDNDLIILEKKLSQRDKDYVDKINLVNKMEELLFSKRKDENIIKNKFKKKYINDFLEWLDNESNNCSLDEIREKYKDLIDN